MNAILYATKDIFANYVNWHGRLSRAGYWWAWLGITLVNLVFSLLEGYVHPMFSYLEGIWSLVTFLPMLFATMRRYHDSGKPGWFALLLYILTQFFMVMGLGLMMLSLFGASAGAADSNAILAVMGTGGVIMLLALLGSILNLIMLLLPSKPRANRYGEPRPFDPNETKSPANGQKGIDLQ